VISFQFLFQRRLSAKQWFSLLILTIGCMFQGLDVSGASKSGAKNFLSPTEDLNKLERLFLKGFFVLV
jgi:hypothetical protein